MPVHIYTNQVLTLSCHAAQIFSLRRVTLFKRHVVPGRASAEDTGRWRIGSCSQLGLSITEMRHTEINECWQEEPDPPLAPPPPVLGQAVDVHEQRSRA